VRTLCSEVQEVISAAHDGQVADHETLAAAKAHCLTCAECTTFAAFLRTAREVPAPAAPDAAVARVLSAVAVEADAVRALVPSATPADSPVIETAVVEDISASRKETRAEDNSPHLRVRLPRTGTEWRTAAPWLATAAVLVVGGVLVTAQGVDFLMRGASGDTAFVADPGAEMLTAPDLSAESATEGRSIESQVPEDAGVPTPYSTSATLSTSFVAFNGFAYRLAGEEGAPAGPSAGSVTSALDSASSPQRLDAWTVNGARAIIVDAGDDRFLRFERVERMLAGSVFGLKADAIDSFDTAVGLPSGIPRPASTDGSPTFVPAGTDDAGTPVFVRPGTDARDGFALAPGAESVEWTWWQPVGP